MLKEIRKENFYQHWTTNEIITLASKTKFLDDLSFILNLFFFFFFFPEPEFELLSVFCWLDIFKWKFKCCTGGLILLPLKARVTFRLS